MAKNLMIAPLFWICRVGFICFWLGFEGSGLKLFPADLIRGFKNIATFNVAWAEQERTQSPALKATGNKATTSTSNAVKGKVRSLKSIGNGGEIVLDGNFESPVVTPTFPDRISGKSVKDFESAGVSKKVSVKDNRIIMALSSVPVFLEDEGKETEFKNHVDSPFGISGINGYSPLLRELGVSWVRYMGAAGIVWGAVEPQRNHYEWRQNDKIYAETYQNHVNIVVTILSPNGWDQGIIHARPEHKFPEHIERYKAFLARVVERYDGDGIDDAPGSPIINHWQVENEGDLCWKDTPENYAKLLKISYEVIKWQNSRARVLISGVSTPMGFSSFYIPVFDHLEKLRDRPENRYFDIFDFHWLIGGSGMYKSFPLPNGKTVYLRGYIEFIRKTLSKYGYDDIPIWITETASHSGMPKQGAGSQSQTEKDQAMELVKRLIYPLSLGVKRIFWSTLLEEHGFADQFGVTDYFDLIGLIHNPLNSGLSHKKLSFYAYKTVANKLKGIDLDRINRLPDGNGNHVYEFFQGNRPIYILWR